MDTNEPTDTGVIIGPCKCGGYGMVFNEQTEIEKGQCHIPMDELLNKGDNT